MKRAGAFFLFALFLIPPLFLQGDILTLKDGRKLEGEITRKGSEVEIKTKFGTVRFPMDQVEKIERKKTKSQEYKERRKEIKGGDGEGHYRLAIWCKEKQMTREMKRELREVLKVNPDHQEARMLLGYFRAGDRWLTAREMENEGYRKWEGNWIPEREYLLKQGWEEFEGRMVSPDEKKKIVEKREEERRSAAAALKKKQNRRARIDQEWKQGTDEIKAVLKILERNERVTVPIVGLERRRDPTTLPAVRRLLQNPLAIQAYGQEVMRDCADAWPSMAKVINICAKKTGLDADIEKRKDKKVSFQESLQSFWDLDKKENDNEKSIREALQAIEGVPEQLRTPLKEILAAMARTLQMREEAFEFCIDTEEDQRKMEAGASQYGLYQSSLEGKEMISIGKDLCDVEHPLLWKAAEVLAESIERALPSLKAFAQAGAKQNETLLNVSTPLGKILVCGKNKDVHEDHTLFLLDLGGADLYKANAGSTAMPSTSKPGVYRSTGVAVTIDLEGDDAYEGPGNFAQGCGFLGVGFLVDLDGKDQYRGKAFSQGAAIAGVGLLFDANGDDLYQAGELAQGAGAFGCGILMEGGGKDSYRADVYAQGYASTLGIGLLLEKAGNDGYFTGGKHADDLRDASKHISFGQGASFGYRNLRLSGGAGILCDLAGDDSYETEIFGQGTGYWYALGLLLDNRGRDSYFSWRYTQGGATHMALGALIDNEGDDRYEAWGVAQGCGHDFSAGLLLDFKGMDEYLTKTLSQGVGNERGSFGLLFDVSGDDIFEGAGNCMGYAGGESLGQTPHPIGIFINLKGDDTYAGRQGAGNSTQWRQENYALGVDR